MKAFKVLTRESPVRSSEMVGPDLGEIDLMRKEAMEGSGSLDPDGSANLPAIMTDKEVAGYLRVTTRQVYNLMKRGLPHFHMESSLRFRRADLEAWIASKVKCVVGNSPNE